MWQKEKKDSLIASLGLFMALTATGVAVVSPESDSALAESSSESKKASFPLPDSVPNGTKIRIDGSSALAAMNQALKEGFEKKFSGANVEIATNGAQKALKNLLDGNIDIAAISRGLTPEEKAQGLQQLRLRREKIAVIVSKDNSFQGSISDEQFAKIFRGEITDWSQLGGNKGKIRFIDHPETSETRESFRSYPVFKKAKFVTGANANLLDSHHAVEVVKQLGKDGLGYVVANQVSQLDGVRVLKMHQTLPDDPRYPYSQPLVYVYKNKPGSAVASFLGFSTATPGQKAIELARKREAETVAKDVLTANNSSSSQNQTDTAAKTESLDAQTQQKTIEVSDNNSTVEGTTEAKNQDPLENEGTLTASNGVDGYKKQIVAQNGSSRAQSTTEIPLWFWFLAASVLGAGGLAWFFMSKGKRARNEEDELETNSGLSLDVFKKGGMTPATATGVGTIGSGMAGAATNLADKKVSRVSNSKGLNATSSAGAVGTGNTAGLQSETSISDLPDTAIGKTSLQDEAQWNLEAPAAIVNNSIPQAADIANSTVDGNPVVGSAEVDITCIDDEEEENSSGFAKMAGATALAAGLTTAVGTEKILSQFAEQDTDSLDGESSIVTNGSLPTVEVISKNPDVGENTSSDINRQQLPTIKITTSNLEELKIDDSEIDTNIKMAKGLPIVEITTPLTENTNQIDEELLGTDVVTDTAQPAGEDVSNLMDNVTAAGAMLTATIGLGSKLSEGQDSENVDGATNTTTNTNVPAQSYPPLPDIWDEVLSEKTEDRVDVNLDPELPNVSQETLDDIANAAEPSAETTAEVITDVTSDAAIDEMKIDVTPEVETDEQATDVVTHEVTDEETTNVVPDAVNLDVTTDEQATDVVTHEVTDEETTNVVPDVVNLDVTTDEQASDAVTHEVTDEETKNVVPDAVTHEVTDEETTNVVPDAVNLDVTTDEKPTDENVASVNPIAVAGSVAAATATTALVSGIWNNDAANDKLADSEDETAIVLTPRTPRWAYTAWKISTANLQQLQQQNDSQLILRLYDVTDVDLSYQTPHLIQQYECEISINHRYVAIPKGDRNYMVEIGYLSNDQRWLSLARSEITRVFSRPQQDFWFEADAELIIHGATEPGATVTIAGNPINVKPNGTFHLRIPFTEEVMEYLMMSSAANSNKAKTINMKFTQEKPKF